MPSEHSLSGVPVVRGNAVLPLEGAWTADLVLNQENASGFAPGTKVTLDLNGARRVGAVLRSSAPYNQLRVRVVAGAAKLATVLEPRDYRGRALDSLVADCLRDAGETPGNLARLAQVSAPHWTRVEESAARAVGRLRTLFPEDVLLRVSDAGQWVVETPTWPAVAATAVQQGYLPTEDAVELATDSGDVAPGTSVSVFGVTRRVDRVQYRIEPDSFRAWCWLRPA